MYCNQMLIVVYCPLSVQVLIKRFIKMNLASDEMIFSLVHPFTLFFVGPSKVGKSTEILRLIERRDEIISHKLESVIYVHAQDQPGIIIYYINSISIA